MLIALITLQDSEMKKKPQKKAIKPMISYWQLRPIYKDSQTHQTDKKISEVMDEEKDLLVGSTRKANYLVL